MTNLFSSLPEESDDTSTNNSRRKLEKMIRKQEKNPNDDRAKRIKELDAIVNPPKTIPKKNKKKNKTSVKKENKENEKQKIRDERFREREKKRKDKEEEEKRREENYEQYKREQEEQNKKRYEKYIKREENKIKKEKADRILTIHKNLPEDIVNFLISYPEKTIYKKLVRKYHPDKGGDEEHFKIINNHMN